MKANKKFAAEVAQAETDANELVEQALFNTALKGNVTAQQVWLYNRDPARWQDRRNITIKDESDQKDRDLLEKIVGSLEVHAISIQTGGCLPGLPQDAANPDVRVGEERKD